MWLADCRPPTVKGSAFKRVLWAVHYIPAEHDQIIRIMLQQGASVISDTGLWWLRCLADEYVANVQAYEGEAAVISVPLERCMSA